MDHPTIDEIRENNFGIEEYKNKISDTIELWKNNFELDHSNSSLANYHSFFQYSESVNFNKRNCEQRIYRFKKDDKPVFSLECYRTNDNSFYHIFISSL